jgi:LmbE family N-acetylglucosaminyl deacetylase
MPFARFAVPDKEPETTSHMFKGIRKMTKRAFDESLRFRAQMLPQPELAQDAWVVAPHPDDETLGCGGTIAEKSAQGARVYVVFASDGSGSHARWMDRADLAVRRKAEGYEACERLGVRSEDVHFLDLPDGDLTNHVERGTASLARLFSDRPVEQFFIPHRLEPPPDHAAAAAMAMGGLREARLKGTVLEYPVWMWARWPWVPRGDDPNRDQSTVRQAPLIAAGVREMISELRWRVDVRPQIANKSQALACHETQTRRFAEATEWPILSDIAGGEFLECFFSGWEYFHRFVAPE